MIPYRFDWFRGDVRVGKAKLRIVETRDEAEDPDHGWYGNSRIYEQLEEVGVQEGYPALLLRWMEIEPEFRGSGCGLEFLKFVDQFAKDNGCKFCFCVVDTDGDVKTMQANQSFYIKGGWSIWAEDEEGKVTRILDEPDWMMAFRDIQDSPESINPEFYAKATEPPDWEKRFHPNRYVPDA